MKFCTPVARIALFLCASLCAGVAASCATGGGDNASGVGGATGTGGASTGSSSGGTGLCTPCVTTTACGAGADCAQFAGDTYCASDCTNGQACPTGTACAPVNTTEGAPVSVCVPVTNPCGSRMSGSTTSTAAVTSTTSATSTSATSTSSTSSGSDTCSHSPCATGTALTSGCDPCATAVCAGDAYCCNNKWDTQCVNEAMSACGASCSGTGSSTTSTSTSSTSSTSTSSSGGPVSALSFAIVGDTRPANDNDTSGYPTSIITQIWKDIEAQSPRPAFAVTTGDYMFASPSSGQAAPQIQIYLTARSNFTNTVYPAMGNHECTGATDSNCGSGSTDGITDNYTQFMTKMLAPLGQSQPYYAIHVNGTNNAWTAKFVFVACNAWSSTQASWLASQLSQSTTYTFVVRHEGTTATTAPCLSGSNNADTIIGKYPHTLLIAGHTHTYAYYSSEKQVIVGNGGAPLSGGVNYGYVIARQQSNGSILFTEYDYQTNKATSSFTVQ